MGIVVNPLLLTVICLVADGALITNLPGAPAVSFKQYAGYYTVANGQKHIHYWFTESQNNPSTDPVILWLTGGPGCSGLSALLTEIGPLLVNKDGNTLSFNKYAWNNKANLLIIESPAGVGYSYASGSVATDDEKVSVESREVLIAFFNEFPQYKTNDFYVIGESYGGIYVPTLVQKIIDGQSEFHFNIKGMAVGNGMLNYDYDTDTLVQYLYNHGMIDETTWQKVNAECCNGAIDGCEFHSFGGWGFCPTFVEETYQSSWMSGVNPYNMFANCESEGPNALKKRFFHEAYMKFGKHLPASIGAVICMNETAVTTYLNRADVRKVLFVPDNLPDWEICSDAVGESYARIYLDMTSHVQNAVKAGLRVLFYHGDGDLACNFLMGQRFSQKLGYAITTPEQTFSVDGQVGGFYTKYGNVEFLTVRGSGHMVPTDKPSVAYHILDAFLNKRKP